MKKNIVICASAILIASLLSGCGTTSDIRKNGSAAANSSNQSEMQVTDAQSETQVADTNTVDLKKYDTVIVLDFENKVMPSDNFLGKRFAEKIAFSIANSGAFKKVERTDQPGPAIVINGSITRYDEGNPTMRLLIGFGAGSSYFDATVKLKDNGTGKELGDIQVDKNSWLLGGGIAMSQDVNSHMQSAAETIAENLAAAKFGKKIETAQTDF